MSVAIEVEGLLSRLGARRVGVVCGPASWLPQRGDFGEFLVTAADVRGFLALEHGLRGELQDGVSFESYPDPRTGIPVYSLYGKDHTFPEAFLAAVEVVVFQVQDVSHRAYTFHGALASLLDAASRTGTAVVVLDRPTPLSHLGAWGYTHEQFFPLPLPIGIPVTHGELGRWLVRKRGWGLPFEVVPARGWARHEPWPERDLPWVPPSPNLPTLASAYAYACTGIIQATNVSEGRGTCKPFEYIGAPFVQAGLLATALNSRRLPGVLFRDVYFKPGFNKYAGEVCGGVHVIFESPARLDPLRTMFSVLQELARLHPREFQTKPGIGQWLDGTAWSAARLAELDIEAEARRAAPAAAAFLADIGPDLVYP